MYDFLDERSHRLLVLVVVAHDGGMADEQGDAGEGASFGERCGMARGDVEWGNRGEVYMLGSAG